MITISNQLMNEVIHYCKDIAPEEACGVWFGKKNKNGEIEIKKFKGVTNISSEPMNNFLMDPQQWISLIYETQHHPQLELVGIFHSHPESLAIPSKKDMETLWKDMLSYWIISFMNIHHTQIRAYRFNRMSYEEIPIIFIDD